MTKRNRQILEYGFWLVALPLAWFAAAWNRGQTWQRFQFEVDWSRVVIEEVTSCIGAIVMVRFVVWWSRQFPLAPPWWRTLLAHFAGAGLFTLGHYLVYVLLRVIAFAAVEERPYQWQAGAVYNLWFEFQKDLPIYLVILMVLFVYRRFVVDVFSETPLQAASMGGVADPASGADTGVTGDSGRLLLATARGDRVVTVSDILYVEAARNYVSYFTAADEFVARETLSGAAARLEGHGFHRTHRSYLVNVSHVKALQDSAVVLSDDRTIPLSRNNRDSLRARLLGNSD